VGKNLLCFYLSAKDDIDLDALAAEIEGAGAAKEQEPQKSKGKKKKDKRKPDFDEDDILKELEELSWEAQGIKADRESAAVKVKNRPLLPVLCPSASFGELLLEAFEQCEYVS
uniref:Uncharacterized protein n=1 Tax=Ursus americanus TaxID=9643 RepID=A0A452QFD9_URSAM